MNEEQVAKWINELIAIDKLHEFYVSKEWRHLRKAVLSDCKDECQVCKAKGFYTKANHVHHIQYVRKHPRLALSKTYIFQGKEYVNLIAVCKDCHENVCHPERLKHKVVEPITEERWE
ncbi:MAG: hypothetical protein K0R15_638 [Clostridiales bacterium]|jgi:5-methylcytosine-specific restriction endonuclease McrA|nr:hypothetical protein [Clostridiales bacterium]